MNSMTPKLRGLGLRNNGRFWAHYVRNVFLPNIAVLRESVVKRVLPAFESVAEEADAASESAWKHLAGMAGPDSDPADLAEAAQDAGIIYYELRISGRQAVVNAFCIALHHLVEQQLILLLRREMLPKDRENDSSLFNRETVRKELKRHEIDVQEFPYWECLEDLRWLANVAKHAEGPSASVLRERRPDLLRPPILKEDVHSPLYSFERDVTNPLSGDDLWVSDEDLIGFFDSASDFWRWLADEVEALGSLQE